MAKAASGNQIRAWREHRGLTQPQLAELVDSTPQQMSRLELGQRGLSQYWIEQLTTALRVSEAELLRDPPPSVHAAPASTGASEPMAEDVQHLMIQLLRELIRQNERQTSALEKLAEGLQAEPQAPAPVTRTGTQSRR